MTKCLLGILHSTFVLVPYSDIAPIPKQMTIVIGLCVVGLMAFGLALSYYKNVLFDRQLHSMQERNGTLRDDITGGSMELRYYQSVQYKDKYAKENFGLLRPGEKVLFVSKPARSLLFSKASDLTDEEREAIYEEDLRAIRVIDHWRIYLFNRGKIEELRKGV